LVGSISCLEGCRTPSQANMSESNSTHGPRETRLYPTACWKSWIMSCKCSWMCICRTACAAGSRSRSQDRRRDVPLSIVLISHIRQFVTGSTPDNKRSSADEAHDAAGLRPPSTEPHQSKKARGALLNKRTAVSERGRRKASSAPRTRRSRA
jgi:hypothetical protein